MLSKKTGLIVCINLHIDVQASKSSSNASRYHVSSTSEELLLSAKRVTCCTWLMKVIMLGRCTRAASLKLRMTRLIICERPNSSCPTSWAEFKLEKG